MIRGEYMTDLKLSIIVPNYNNEEYLPNAIDSLLRQTYSNIEIIIVNDGSTGNCDSIIAGYNDVRLKYIKHKKNQGLFQARLTGADAATGDYIGFLDADDYISIDLCREAMELCSNKKYDIIVENTILDYGEKKVLQNMRESYLELVDNKNLLDEYFRQEGLNFSWHTLSTKIYSMDLWKKARKHYDKIRTHLVMAEDFAFSTVLFYYAKTITKLQEGAIFYRQSSSAPTSSNNLTYKKVEKNINDLIISFNFVQSFLVEKQVYNKYKVNFFNWKHLYATQHRFIINNSTLCDNDKDKLNNLLNKFNDSHELIQDDSFFYIHQLEWDERLEKLKTAICSPNIKVISFDIFDTLILRPFYKPLDLFKLLDADYRNLNGNDCGIPFSKMRIIAESIARKRQYKKDNTTQEITLQQIYSVLIDLYNLDEKQANFMMKKEQEAEIKFCTRRSTAFNLYKMALSIGKKVICTSDMYLPENTILDILNANGYNEISKVYLSSTVKKTKSTGDLFKYVINDLNINENEMIHIGDNYFSDYEMPKGLGIISFHFTRPIDIMTNCSAAKIFTSSLPFWQDNRASLDFLGIRTFITVIANKYFDNPYREFDNESDFNADPYFIGYFALGMYQFGIARWIITNSVNKYDKIAFMARDGFLPMEAYKLLKPLYSNLPEEEYIFVSRKALIPVMICDESDFFKLADIINFSSQTPKKVIKYLNGVLNINVKKLELLCNENNIVFDETFTDLESFNEYIKLLVEHFYDKNVHMKNRKKLKKYFEESLSGRAAVFDVGYSGRPEFSLSKLLNKNIDTFFLNINSDEALEYSKLAKYILHTFFPAKPAVTGNAYECLLSKIAPSCIGYDLSENSIKPIFEEYHISYQASCMIEVMQKAALDFVSDIIKIFGKDIETLYYQNYYISLPIMAYINSANTIDKLPIFPIQMEDEIRNGKTSKMVESMNLDLTDKNQHSLEFLFNLKTDAHKKNTNENEFIHLVDLNGKSKLYKALFYILYDKATLKRREKEIVHNITKKIKNPRK